MTSRQSKELNQDLHRLRSDTQSSSLGERSRVWSHLSSLDSHPHRGLRSSSFLSEDSFKREERRQRQTVHAVEQTSLEMANFTVDTSGTPTPLSQEVRPKRHSWAGSLRNWIGLVPDSSEAASDNDLDMQVEVNEVAVVQAEKEWCGGCDLSSDSSGSEMAGWRRNRRPMASPEPGPPGPTAEVPVQVVQVEKEWGGADSDSDDGATSMVKAGEERRRQLAQREEAMAAAASQTFSMRPKEPPSPGPPEPPEPAAGVRRVTVRRSSVRNGSSSSGSVRRLEHSRSFTIRRDLMNRCWGAVVGWYGGFLAFSLLHFADCILRIYSIYLYASYELHVVAFCMLTPIQVIGAMLSIYITFHDADVLLIMHNSRGWQKLLFFLVSLVFLGCCQLIQVKRAWSRQLHSPEVVVDMDDTKTKEAADYASDAGSLPDFGAAERITPVALVTGVPFLLVHWVSASRYVEAAAKDGEPIFWWITAVVLVLTVSLGIVDIDFSVSSYVVRRYQYQSHQGSSRCSGCRRLFKPLHVMFRITEVWMRLLVLAGIISIRYELFDKDDLVLSLTVVIDYGIGVNLLFRNAPAQESGLVHIFAGIGLLVADVGHFIDLPNFALAAREISRRLAWLRFAQILLLLGVYHWVFWNKDEVAFGRILHFVKLIYGTSIVYYLMRYSRPIWKVGSDLHTASLDGDLTLVKALLKPDQNGQVLDVNAASKDGQSMTPLMLASQNGHVEVMEELLHNGAKVGAQSALRKDTALHFAAGSKKVEACTVLIKHRADIHARNRTGQKPLHVAKSSMLVQRNDLIQILTQGLPYDDSSFIGMSGSSVGRMDKKRATYYSVKAKPVAGLELRSLFPNLEKDDTPSPRVLQSVSSLVVSKAAGPLGRRALMREENSGSVPLGALRRVRELGRGGFGRVIEVELPRDAASSIWRSPKPAQRFALKLQLKQDHRQASSEVLALQRAEHPFIVHLHRAFAFDKYLALLLELCPTDLNRLLCEEPGDGGRYLGLDSKRVALYTGQVMLALAYLHESDIVYRDVKPENILINTKNEAKLTDFGLAKVVTSAERMTMCGTLGFLSPELTGAGLMSRGDGDSEDGDEEAPEFNPFKTDAYSFGVTLQVALLGEDGARRKTVKRKGPMMLPLHLSEHENAELLAQLKLSQRLSQEAFDLLVEKLLPFSQARRSELKSVEVKNHPFFQTELQCKNVEEFLLSSHGRHPGSSVMSPSMSNW